MNILNSAFSNENMHTLKASIFRQIKTLTKYSKQQFYHGLPDVLGEGDGEVAVFRKSVEMVYSAFALLLAS